MDENMLTAYMSHSIRGRKGDKCSEEEMQANNMKAIVTGLQLQQILNQRGVPIQIYIPGLHDEFVMEAYKKKFITEEQILDTDCVILDKRDLLLVYDWADYQGGGVGVEMDYAEKHSIPTTVFTEITEESIRNIVRMCYDLMDDKESDDGSTDMHQS